MTLQDFFKETPKAAIAFSGGVDSAYLLYAAHRCGADVRPYYVKSVFQPQFELEDALRLTQQLGMPLTVLGVDILADETVRANPQNRCYFCKQRMFSRITAVAASGGYSVVLDGTNASDDASDRPGMRALSELEILSPLRLCGLTKTEIRRRSREAGLFTWDKPSYACLATRISAGTPLDEKTLSAVEQAEDGLMALGLRNVRARVESGAIRLELLPEQIPYAEQNWDNVTNCIQKAFPNTQIFVKVRQNVT